MDSALVAHHDNATPEKKLKKLCRRSALAVRRIPPGWWAVRRQRAGFCVGVAVEIDFVVHAAVQVKLQVLSVWLGFRGELSPHDGAVVELIARHCGPFNGSYHSTERGTD